jgi:ribosomal protein S18 acetylase RimI-like enzyme
MRIVTAQANDAGTVTEQIRAGLASHNEPLAGPRNTRPLVLALHDEGGAIIGGLTAKTYWNALHIELLWVEDSLRSQGWGRRLVEAAERGARARGAEHAYVTTISFQAPGFYEKLGYCKFAELEGVPRGASRLWYRKAL